MSDNKYRIDTVYTAGKIIELVAGSKEPLSKAVIAKSLSITINMSMRMCETLEELSLFDKVNDKYRLGMKLALYWAKKKALLQGDRDQIGRSLEELGEE